MGEIESYLHQNLENAVDLATVIATPVDGRPPFLAAFLCLRDGSSIRDKAESSIYNKCLDKATIQSLVDRLTLVLPQYMIPKVYIPVSTIPLTISQKCDRQALQTLADGLTASEFAYYSGQEDTYSAPVTENELRIQLLWSDILKLPRGSIGRNDSFTRLGGDSILAMKLVAAAREDGINLTVANIFQAPILSDLAGICADVSNSRVVPQNDIEAFSMIDRRDGLLKAAIDGGFEASHVEDLYPCTPFQEAIMALSIGHPGTYIAQYVFELSKDIYSNLEGFRSAWNQVAHSNPILRTRIIQPGSSGLMQIVIAEDVVWNIQDNLQRHLRADKELPMGLGAPLSRYCIVEEINPDGRKYFFVLTLHHAVYDAWSMNLILQQAGKEYEILTKNIASNSKSVQRQNVPFNRFIRAVLDFDRPAAEEFWRSEFASGSTEPTHFPGVRAGYQPQPGTVSIKEIRLTRKANSDFRVSNLIRTAWAIALSNYSNSNDIVFGEVLAGRTGSSADLTRIVGPTLATVPVSNSSNIMMT